MAVIEFTAAPSGTGKSFDRCARFLADQWLPLAEGVHWSNFPVFIDPLVAYVLERHPDFHEPWLRERVQTIPADELDRWRREESGPWTFFLGKDLTGAHVA